MAYTLYHSDGKLFLTLADQQTNKVDTSLTLIGKNVTGYGADINQNYVRLLENFANTVEPTSPQVGQVWYDTLSQQIKVYTASGSFKPVGNPIISPTKPRSLSIGDLWYDSVDEQLKFQADASNPPIVIGPFYSATAGKTGWVAETYSSSTGSSQTVVVLYANDVALGVLSSVDFTSNDSRAIHQGFNATFNSTVQTKFYGTASFAESIAGVEVSQLITDTSTVHFTHNVEVISAETELQLTLGADQDFQFYASTTTNRVTTATILIGGTDQNFELIRAFASTPSIFVGANGRVGFFERNPQSDVDIKGNVVVQGNLVVQGSSTFITAQDLRVVDKTIVLNELSSGTNEPAGVAHGGGIWIRDPANGPDSNSWGSPGISWVTSNTARISDPDTREFTGKTPQTWTFTGGIDLRFANSGYFLFGERVAYLEPGTGKVVSGAYKAPDLIQIGNLESASIAEISFRSTSSWVNTTYPYASIISSERTGAVLVIGDDKTAYVDVGDNIIRSVATPTSSVAATVTPIEFNKMAANVGFVKDYVQLSRNPMFSTTIDVTAVITSTEVQSLTHPAIDTFVKNMLTFMYDPGDPELLYRAPDNTRARVICIRYATPGVGKRNPGQLSTGGIVSDPIDLGLPFEVRDVNGAVVKAVEFQTPGPVAQTVLDPFPMKVYRGIKEYVVNGGVWKESKSGDNVIWAGNFDEV